MDEQTVYLKPFCSMRRAAQGMLADKSVDATYRQYLDTPLTIDKLSHPMALLAIDDPRE